jgi:pre-mRNA-processing factor SLU7
VTKNAAGKEVDLTHMPEFIKTVPFYLTQGSEQPVLQHQRQKEIAKKTSIHEYHKRGLLKAQSGPQVTKFRKGACTNCGSLTHSAKTCIERPRKVGAKYTGKDLGRDEII